jgi:sec-independent protein translocase protein TatA
MCLPLAFIEGIGGPEVMMIMFVVLLLFGADKLPELARGMGKTLREVKKATSGVEQEIKRAMEEEPPTTKTLPKPAASVPQQPTPIPDKFPPYPPAME